MTIRFSKKGEGAPNRNAASDRRSAAFLCKKAICILLCVWFSSQLVFSQDAGNHVAPNSLRRPHRGEAPRYPTDLVIGALGRGEASEGAYNFARNILSALMGNRREAPVFVDSATHITESLFDEINSFRPRTVRLGGGRVEPDGSISFLVRFISRDESLTGELFVRWIGASESSSGAGRWILDDLALENRIALSDIRETFQFNFSPHERFF